MNQLNEGRCVIKLRDYMDSSEGWGRAEGREVCNKLLQAIEERPGIAAFPISVEGIKRVDISFASETIVEIARRFRGKKVFYFLDLVDADMIENWEAAAERKEQPIYCVSREGIKIIGAQPSQGTREALDFALSKGTVRAAEFVEAKSNVSIANASAKFKQLWEQGFLLRKESAADTGGVEYVYEKVI